MDKETMQCIQDELLNKYDKEDILNSIKNVNIRLLWKINSSCLIFSRSNNKWFNANISKIINIDKEEWLIVKYNHGKNKQIQRFCVDIKPIDLDINHDDDNKEIIKYIVKKLKQKQKQKKQGKFNLIDLDKNGHNMMITAINKPIIILKASKFSQNNKDDGIFQMIQDKDTKSIQLLSTNGCFADGINLFQEEFLNINYQTGDHQYKATNNFLNEELENIAGTKYVRFTLFQSIYENVIAIILQTDDPAIAGYKHTLELIMSVNQTDRKNQIQVFGDAKNEDFKEFNNMLDDRVDFGATWQFIAKDWLLIHETDKGWHSDMAIFLLYNFRTKRLKSFNISSDDNMKLFCVKNTDINGQYLLYFKNFQTIYIKLLNINDMKLQNIGWKTIDNLRQCGVSNHEVIAIHPDGKMIGVGFQYERNCKIFDKQFDKIIFECDFKEAMHYELPDGFCQHNNYKLFWIKKDILMLSIRMKYNGCWPDDWRVFKLFAICDIRNDKWRRHLLFKYLDNIECLVSEILDFIRFEPCNIELDDYLKDDETGDSVVELITEQGHGIFTYTACRGSQRCYYVIQ